MDLRSNLSKARGLGSAHEGVHHWLMQRITAVALIPLVLWFVSSVIKAVGYHGIEGVIYLLSSPFNAVAMILFLGVAIYHGTLGIKVVIEDYVHCHCVKLILEISTKFVAVVSIVAVTFTIFYATITSYKNPEKYTAGFWGGLKADSHKEDASDAKKPDAENMENETTDTESPKE